MDEIMNWHFEQKVDLQQPSGLLSYPDLMIAQGDHLAHTWRVQVYSGGRPMDLTGYTVTGYFDRSDGKMVPVIGSAVGHVASVVLPQSVYAAVGPLTGLLRAGKDGQIITLSACRWIVRRGPGDEIVDPSHVVPSLDELLAKVGEMERQINAAKAATASANKAASTADTAADKANVAASHADAKAAAARTVAGKANNAAINAAVKAAAANTATGKANTAADNANEAAASATTATEKANAATEKANAAAENANTAAETSVHGIGKVTSNWNGMEQNLLDANNAEVNRIYSIQKGGGIVANLPEEQGTLITMNYIGGSEVAGKFQLFCNHENKVYTRIYWKEWSAWGRVANAADVASANEAAASAITAAENANKAAETSVQGIGKVTSTWNGMEQNLFDANDAEVNRIYTIQTGGGIVANLPEDQGTLITMNYVSGSKVAGKFQLFCNQENKVYTRIYWAEWSAWERIANAAYVASALDLVNERIGGALTVSEWKDGVYVKGIGELVPHNSFSVAVIDVSTIRGCDVKLVTHTESRASYAIFDDNNKYIRGYDGEFVPVGNGLNTFVTDVPFNAKYLYVSCHAAQKDKVQASSYGIDKAIGRLSNHLTVPDEPLAEIKKTTGLFGTFRTLTAIGDSLASGEHEYNKADGSIGYIDLFDYSWAQYMARDIGGTAYNLSKGGASTRTWLNDFASRLSENPTQAYIIALAVNDMGSSDRHVDVGTAADIGGENTNSYYRNYAKIIELIKAVQPRAKIFCVTMPNEGGDTATRERYNQAVRDIVSTTDSCYLIDLFNHADGYADAAFRAQYFSGGHMNAMGYRYTAWMLETYIDWIINKNPADFKDIAFIGTDYRRS